MHFYVFKDRRGEYRWTLYAANGEPVADSAEGYTRLASCIHGIHLVRGRGAAVPIRYAPGILPRR